MSRRQQQTLVVVPLPGSQTKPHGSSLDVQEHVVKLPLSKILDNPIPARTVYTPALIKQRAEEIKRDGLLDAIKVRRNPDGSDTFILIDGKTRVEAYRQYEIDTEILGIIRNVDAVTAGYQGYAANHDRDDGTDIDEAFYFRHMQRETGARQEDIALHTGTSQAKISALMSFFKLPEEALGLICSSETPGNVTYKHVQMLTKENKLSQEKVVELVLAVLTHGWTKPELQAAINVATSAGKQDSNSRQTRTVELPNGAMLQVKGRSFEVKGLPPDIVEEAATQLTEWLNARLK